MPVEVADACIHLHGFEHAVSSIGKEPNPHRRCCNCPTQMLLSSVNVMNYVYKL